MLMTLDGESGLSVNSQASVRVLQITGGSDFSENFDVNVAPVSSEAVTAKIEAGMLVSIDPANPGKLLLSARVRRRERASITARAPAKRAKATMKIVLICAIPSPTRPAVFT